MVSADQTPRLLLLPVLIWQALGVRRRALSLPEPAGPKSETAGTGPVLRPLITGDSSAAGVGVSNQGEALSGQLVTRFSRSQHFPALPQPLAWVLGKQADRLDQQIAALAGRTDGMQHLPLDLPADSSFAAKDGYHPNAKAYALWASAIMQAIDDPQQTPR